jgi:hypothetical protein
MRPNSLGQTEYWIPNVVVKSFNVRRPNGFQRKDVAPVKTSAQSVDVGGVVFASKVLSSKMKRKKLGPKVIKLLRQQVINVCSKLECLSLAGLSKSQSHKTFLA